MERPIYPALDSAILVAGVGACCGLWPQRISDEVLFPESVSMRRSVDGSVLRVQDEVLFPELAAWSGNVAAVLEVAECAGVAVEEESQAVEGEELELFGRGWDQLATIGHNYLIEFNVVDSSRLLIRGRLASFNMEYLNLNLSLVAPLGIRRNFWPWINDHFLHLSGFSSTSSKVCTTVDMSVGSSWVVREVVDDSISTAFDVGTRSFDGLVASRPSFSCFEVGECSGSAPTRGLLGCSDTFSVCAREDAPVVEVGACADDPALDFSPPKPRPRGRPKKLSRARRECSRRPRGRPRKSASVDIAFESAPPNPPSPSGPYFTRAMKAWCLAKSVGMSFPGSDDDAIRGLAEVIKENFPSRC